MAVRFTVGDVEEWREFHVFYDHEESRNAGNNVRTAIMEPARQAGQVVGMVGSGRVGSEWAGEAWRS